MSPGTASTSGFLIGGIIIDKGHLPGFFETFYIRRFCKIIPVYVVIVVTVLGLIAATSGLPWGDRAYPTWTYATFTQGVWASVTNDLGGLWLRPTWTLAVEEWFYVVVPFFLVFAPRRWRVPGLLAVIVLVNIGRLGILYLGSREMGEWARQFPASRADVLAFGVLAAIVLRSSSWASPKINLAIRITPIPALVLTAVAKATSETIFFAIVPALVGVAFSALILVMMQGAPEGRRVANDRPSFLGRVSYALYLVHVPVLGLMHGIVLGSRPDVGTPAQWAVTLASLPLSIALAWVLTKYVEEPSLAFGRRWVWGKPSPAASFRTTLSNP